MYSNITNCRACGRGNTIYAPGIKVAEQVMDLPQVFDLGVQPLANDFVPPGCEHQGWAPLKVLFCPNCFLAQLSVVVRPEILYSGQYLYVTSKSTMMHDHFGRIWEAACSRASLRTVLEIGSNDGDFLQFCKARGAEKVIGVEPSDNLSDKARVAGIATFTDFWTEETARLVKAAMPEVGMIFARHVFCHVNDWKAFMSTLSIVADNETLICIEVPYILDQLKTNSFDQIYHEHLSYLTIRAINKLLEFGPFRLVAVERFPIHGGSIMLFIRRETSNVPVQRSVDAYLEAERDILNEWKQFNFRAQDAINGLALYVKELTRERKRVCGFGASAKSTVWINACKFTRGHIYGVYDCTPEKWGRFIPGTDIPVLNQGAFYADGADYAVLFAWNFAAEVLSTQKKWMMGGGKFIVPIPKVRVIGIDSDTGGE